MLLQRKHGDWSSLLDGERPGEESEGMQPQQGGDAAHRGVPGVDMHACLLRCMRVDAEVALYVTGQGRQHRLPQRPQNLIVVGLRMQPPVSVNISTRTCTTLTS